jgi:hypothetical protein
MVMRKFCANLFEQSKVVGYNIRNEINITATQFRVGQGQRSRYLEPEWSQY